MKAKNIQSNFLFFGNTSHNQHFVKKWLDFCCSKEVIRFNGQTQQFEHHLKRRDQTCLNISVYTVPHGIKLASNQLPQKKYVSIRHHRHPGNHQPVLFLLKAPFQDLLKKSIPRFYRCILLDQK